jgi:hypothetical protein
VLNDTADRYHAQPAEACHRAEPLAADFTFNDSQPAPSADFTAEARPKRRANRGSFKPGPDSRRHVFTAEECSRGFWVAIAVLGCGIGQKLNRAGRWPGYRRAGR